MPLDPSTVARVVASIPAGRWMSYGDVAHMCGGTAAHARTLNQYFIRYNVVGAHRVLMADGTVSATALGDPDGVRERLKAEGVRFSEGRACPDARLYPRDFARTADTGSQACPGQHSIRNCRPRHGG